MYSEAWHQLSPPRLWPLACSLSSKEHVDPQNKLFKETFSRNSYVL